MGSLEKTSFAFSTVIFGFGFGGGGGRVFDFVDSEFLTSSPGILLVENRFRRTLASSFTVAVYSSVCMELRMFNDLGRPFTGGAGARSGGV